VLGSRKTSGALMCLVVAIGCRAEREVLPTSPTTTRLSDMVTRNWRLNSPTVGRFYHDSVLTATLGDRCSHRQRLRSSLSLMSGSLGRTC
jgi:hypothetical protein